MNHLTLEQRAALPMVMNDVMRSCAGRPAGDWRSAASAYRNTYTYDETIAWLSRSIKRLLLSRRYGIATARGLSAFRRQGKRRTVRFS